jgi:hypothetical protein
VSNDVVAVAVSGIDVTVGSVSATRKVWVASADWLPYGSVIWAVTFSALAPSASVVASALGIVADQPVPAPFTVAV